jgi:vanillate O-demethylase monooxygenase subunit
MLTTTFVRDQWYVAAFGHELGRDLLGRTILGEPIVFYRSESGEPVALADRCVHRRFPLSESRLDGDRIVCGYHGFEYDADGRCVRVPSQPNVPHGVCVRRFSVHEDPPFVWIWLGDAGAAGLRPPPRLPWLASDGWASSGESFRVEANYLLLHEHALDLTHIFVTHPEKVPPGLASLPPLDEVEVSEMSVAYSRVLPPARLAEWEAEATHLSGDAQYVRREQGTFVSPALHVGRYAIEADDHVYEHYRIQAFTPETVDATRVFLQVARNYAIDRAHVTDHLRAMFHELAVEDKALVEKVQAHRALEPWAARRDVNVTADRAAMKARRVAQAMVAEEAGRAPVRPQFAQSLRG